MRTFHEEVSTETVLDTITCNRCKRIFKISDNYDQFEIQEMICIYETGGYASIMGDGATYKIDLCQHCFKELLGEYIEYEGLEGGDDNDKCIPENLHSGR